MRFRQLAMRPISYVTGGHKEWYADPNQAWQTGLKQAEKVLSDALEEAELVAGITASPAVQNVLSKSHSNRVFILHGHDEAARESVARSLEKVCVDATVLHEKPTEGRTVVEKLEHHANVDFAVVLLRPDDIGASRAEGPSR